MTAQLWHWDNDEMHIVSDQGDHLAIEEFIMYVNGLERETGCRSTAVLGLAGYNPPPDNVERPKKPTPAPPAKHGTSFIELKCHNCGAIIDATLTQIPRKQLCTKEAIDG